jgi:AcrR family transcriptional regulator
MERRMTQQSRAQERKANTLRHMQLALMRLQRRGDKVSIRAVAVEAGVDASLIHHTYPDFAEEIRALVGRTTRQRQEEMRDELKAERTRRLALQQEVNALRADLQKLASANLTLHVVLQRLQDAASSKGTEESTPTKARATRIGMAKV